MTNERYKILKHFAAIVLVIIIGVCAGRIGRVLYNLNFHDVELFEGDDIRGETEIESAGRHYSIVPFIFEKKDAPAKAAALLKNNHIDCQLHDGKVMVENTKIPLAMDLLQAAGFSPDARHFSFREITVDPAKEPERYAVQNRLATQNMLANMIALMAEEIIAAEVRIDPETHTATVRLTRKNANKPLPAMLGDDIQKHVKAVTGNVEVKIESVPAIEK